MRRLRNFFKDEEEGAALTEFVLTLPIFIIIMGGIITLGQVGSSSVSVKATAYAAMWQDAKDKTTGEWKAMTPRSKLDDPVRQITKGVLGSALDEFIGGLPGDFEGPGIGVDPQGGADGAVGLGGHWGEAEYYGGFGAMVSQGDINPRDHERLGMLDASPGSTTQQILGHGLDGSNKPRLALDDNLLSNQTFKGFDLNEMWAEPTSVNEFIKKAKSTLGGAVENLLYDLISATGFAPGLMAGIRYGRGVGGAASSVKVKAFGTYEANHHAVYMTALSPHTDGALNKEKVQWLFYVGGTQLNDNQRNMLSLLRNNLKTSDMTAASPYWGAD